MRASPLQQLFLEQLSVFLVSIDVIDLYKVGMLGFLVASFEASAFLDVVDRFERIDAWEGITQHDSMPNDNNTLQMHPRLSKITP
jgi:hypothetical protein